MGPFGITPGSVMHVCISDFRVRRNNRISKNTRSTFAIELSKAKNLKS